MSTTTRGPPEFARQSRFGVRLGWGPEGLAGVGRGAAAVVVVDVLSFSTATEVATSRGIEVVPCAWRDGRSAELARELGAVLAGRRGSDVSLSPSALAELRDVDRIVLPSPNGSALTHAAAETGATVLLGCLRNRAAVARAALAVGPPIAVIAAGERWPHDGSLRPALEDLLGSGAVIEYVLRKGAEARGLQPSPEALAAAATFSATEPRLVEAVRGCASGLELCEQGWSGDVELAAALDVSPCVPRLVGDVIRASVGDDPGSDVSGSGT